MSVQDPRQMHQAFQDAFNGQDIDRLMALYEPDSALVPQPGVHAAGTDQVREALMAFLALNGQIELETYDVVDADDLALTSGRWVLNGTGPDGQPVTLGGVTAEVLRRGADGAWRFAIDHPVLDQMMKTA